MSVSAVAFDFGKVIVDWDPVRAVRHLYPDDRFSILMMERFGFFDWNLELDRGRPPSEALAAASDGEARQMFAAYLDNIDVAHEAAVPGTAELIERLDARSVPLYGLTNASREAAASSRRQHPAIERMWDVVVSAEEGVLKPDRAIYDILIERVGAPAREIAFVDDNAANVEGARAAGLVAHHFTGADGLEVFLVGEGLL